jgi:tRNA-splicing ligase RtcB
MSIKNIKYSIKIPREGDMNLDAVVYSSPKLKMEESAIQQLKNAASIPSTVHISATPDIHQGYGVPIGAILGTSKVVVPAAVGYDINCGMRMLTTGIQMEAFKLEEYTRTLRQHIPLGEGKENLKLSSGDFTAAVEGGIEGLGNISKKNNAVWDAWDGSEARVQAEYVEDRGSLDADISCVSPIAVERGKTQLATLGGGNHFIEIQRVEEIYDPRIANTYGLNSGEITIMIHTGSRGFGHQIGGDYMKIANKKTEKTGSSLAKKGLGFIPYNDKDGVCYLKAMNCAANFAFVNRFLLYLVVKKNLAIYHPEADLKLLYDVPHNILKVERHNNRDIFVHRKGATRAFGPKRMAGTIFSKSGQPVLIPGSMGTASYVLSGVDDNEETLCSVNHGAGRVMSRTEAKGKIKKGKVIRPPAISDDEFKRAMKGIILYAENMRTIKEEAPQAYKDIDEVIKVVSEAGLANKVARVRPLAVLKG